MVERTDAMLIWSFESPKEAKSSPLGELFLSTPNSHPPKHNRHTQKMNVLVDNKQALKPIVVLLRKTPSMVLPNNRRM